MTGSFNTAVASKYDALQPYFDRLPSQWPDKVNAFTIRSKAPKDIEELVSHLKQWKGHQALEKTIDNALDKHRNRWDSLSQRSRELVESRKDIYKHPKSPHPVRIGRQTNLSDTRRVNELAAKAGELHNRFQSATGREQRKVLKELQRVNEELYKLEQKLDNE